VVWRLDWLGHSLKHLIEKVEPLEGLDGGLQSVTEAIDTTTSVGKLVFHLFAALAEFERAIPKARKPNPKAPNNPKKATADNVENCPDESHSHSHNMPLTAYVLLGIINL